MENEENKKNKLLEEEGMEFIRQPERQIPVYSKTEVIVVGGGPAGLSAAIAAVRQGCKTILIDDGGIIGGTITKCFMPSMGSVNFAIIKGFFAEFCGKLVERGDMIKIEKRSSPLNPEAFQAVAFDYVEKEGIDLLLHTKVVDVVRHDNTIDGVLIANKSGLQAVMGDVVVDASGDGDVAAMAGEAADTNGERQPMTLMFAVGGADAHRFAGFVRDYPDKNEFSSLGMPITSDIVEQIKDKVLASVWGFFGLIKKAREKGELYLPHESLAVIFLPMDGVVAVNATHVTKLNPLSAKDITLAEIESRKQMLSVHHFLKNNIPGFENTFLMSSASRIGVRESRRIICEYVLKQDDVMNGRSFHDAVALNGGGISIHGPGESHTWITLEHPYQIPYRCLLAKVNKNLLVAGRCLSADHVAHASIRNVPICFATGQAAGTAAALSVRNKVAPKDLDVKLLQDTLSSHGAVLTESP